MPFQIIRNDITKVKADAIVNTANPDVAIGDGVDSAIYAAAGEQQLLEARAKIGILEVGEVGITPAFRINARYIIHSSGPAWWDGKHREKELLRQCYDKSLNLAFENGCKSIAFPLMATGTYGFPKEIGMQIAIDAFTSFLLEHDMDITLVVFSEYAYHVSGHWFDDVKSFVDDGYVEQKCLVEYQHDGIPAEKSSAILEAPIMMSETAFASFSKSSDSLDDMLKEIYTDSFEKHLQQLINKKGLKNSEVYTAANINKQYFSKLLKGKIKPSKEKVLSLAIGLRLNLDETIDFLSLAGYALSPISQTDKIVEYHIVHEEYSVIKINIVLFDYGLPSLSE